MTVYTQENKTDGLSDGRTDYLYYTPFNLLHWYGYHIYSLTKWAC